MQNSRLSPKTEEKPIHELLARRWSPRAFAARPVEAEKLRRLFEAARRAPSSYNEQPWSFVLARREEAEGFTRLLSMLVEMNQSWAQHAPVLVLGVTHREHRCGGRPNRHALYDLGQAVAHLTVEAMHQGLHVHQIGGFDAGLARDLFAIPSSMLRMA